MQIHKIAAFLDELEKIGGRMQMAGYMQSRRGIRPYRVDTLLSRQAAPSSPSSSEPQHQGMEADAQAPELTQTEPAQTAQESQDDQGQEASIGKVAADETFREKVMGGLSEARPYAVSGIKAGVPAALFGKIMIGEGPKASHAARIAGLVGASLGVGNEAMKRWAEQNKRQALAKKILNVENK